MQKGYSVMILSTVEMMTFKKEYLAQMKKGAKKVVLTPYDAKHQDYWAYNLFGSAEFSFMFDVLVSNVDHALEFGYEIAV